MTQLRSFATDYNGTEDRIRLRCAFADGDCATLWLTQRLATRLVQHLEGVLLERQPETAQAPSAIQNEAAPPSEAACARRQWVIETIDISPLAGPTKPVQLTFRNATKSAQVTLERAAVKQWLDCLRRLYVTAHWAVLPGMTALPTADPAPAESPELPKRRQRTH